MSEPSVITKSDLARRVSVSPGQVTHWIAAGMPVRDDGRLDAEAVFAWIRSNLSSRSKAARALAANSGEPVPAVARGSPDPEGDELRQIQVRRARLALERDEEDRQRQAGRYIDAAEAKAAWTRELVELIGAEERWLLADLVGVIARDFVLDPARVKAIVRAAWREWRSSQARQANLRANYQRTGGDEP